jgi:hypothetical protein
MRFCSRILAGLASMALLAIPRSARAADVLWVNPSGGNWSVGANWSGGSPPGANDTAVFNVLSGPYAVETQGTRSVESLAINSPNVTLRIQGSSAAGVGRLTVTNGFTNNGVIELTDIDSSWGAELAVTNGTLTNAVGAEIRTLVGANGSGTLSLQLDNHGTVSIARPTTLSRASADHVNSGTIQISGGSLSVSQSGTTPSFVNNGTVNCAGGNATFSGGTVTNASALSVGAGRTLLFNSGAVFNQNAGTLTTTGGTLSFSGATGNFATDYSNAGSSLLLSNATLNGPAMITNASGLTLAGCTINAPFTSQADILVTGASTIANPNGSFANAAAATLRIQGSSAAGVGRLTVTNGFTNNGVIELTDINLGWGAELAVTNGTLTNAPGAELRTLVGENGTGTLSLQLDNHGTVSIARPTTLSRASADHVNSGTIQISGGSLSVSQSGTTPSFVNNGTVNCTGGNATFSGGTVTSASTLSVGAGRTLLFNSGAVFNQNAGTLTTTGGTLSFNGATGNFATDYSNAGSSLLLSNATLNGPGMITNASGLTLAGSTINAPFTSQADILVTGASTIANPNGSFANAAAATLRIQGSSAAGVGRLTVTNGFTNNGVIELTDINLGWGAELVVTNGTLTNAASGKIQAIAGMNGTRRFYGALSNLGLVTIDLGQLFSVTGTITQQNPGRIDFFAAGLNPQQLSRLAVTGAAQLAGGIGMTLVNDFLPAIGDGFQIITYGSLSDAIGCFDIAGLFFGTGLRYNLLRNPTNLTLEVVDNPVQTGDVRCDCTVDLADLSILLAHFGSMTARQSEGDLNDDSTVSLADLAVLLSYFGTVCPD